MKINILILIVLFMAIVGCGHEDQDNMPSLPTSGKLVIGIDESLKPFVDAEIAVFSFLYPDSKIRPLYLPEKKVVEKLLTNEIQTGIICRGLYQEESDFIKNNYGHSAATFKLAYDEIVAVVNNANPVNTISCEEIYAILSGTITDWDQLDGSFKTKSPIMIIIPGSSSIDRYFSSSDNPFSLESIFALETTTEVIDYLKDNVSAIGIVGGSWFYQKGNKYSDVKLLVYSEGRLKCENRKQSISREVYAITHEPFTGLGNGFISFIASQKGQLIISKAGMTPYKPVEREIKIIGSF